MTSSAVQNEDKHCLYAFQSLKVEYSQRSNLETKATHSRVLDRKQNETRRVRGQDRLTHCVDGNRGVTTMDAGGHR